ncbi:DEAD/DEAH box helicase [Sandarakinorhabdus sp.]|uniref:DEAD/DEAH box helicase n=1 Tax=Sandarakinorhabdus sp. TaxID=1916663 RepID=UPI00286E60F8|nr:DEAD/DEAH box helicase [Sandarakinorhabdus sp.]
MSFSDLGLSDALLRAVADSGYDTPTPIQRQAIPSVLMGKDIIAIAQTGTGKTASFVLPMIDILAEGRSRALMPRSLILEPTRELAQQVAENFDKYGKNHKLSMALLIGGVSMGDQLSALEKGVDVLIATPGRLMDLFARGKILLSGCAMLVIDEADRMLDMGFIPDIETICSKLPKSRQTLLFSATMPPPIKKLADQFMDAPKSIEVARAASTNTNITQWIVETSSRDKKDLVRSILRQDDVKTAIIFCNKKTMVRDLADLLKRAKLPVGQIHGDMEQSDRIRELDRFKQGDITILVASDVAARGLDVPGVSHVINFDMPWHPDDYVHRIGRTGRAGRSGTAISFATPEDAENLSNIEKLTRQKIPRWTGGAAAPVQAAAPVAAETAETDEPRSGDGTGDRRRARRPRREKAPVETAVAVAAVDEPVAAHAAQPAPRSDRRRRDERAPRGARPARDVQPAAEAPAPREARPPRAETAPRAERAPRSEKPRAVRQAAAGDPLASYRAIALAPPPRRGNDDDGERFTGFGPEGVPGFLSRPIRSES